MKLDFYHNKIVADVISEEFESCFMRELVPVLTAKYGEIAEAQMYEDYLSDNLFADGYWYYPLTLVVGGEIKTQWIRWEINRTDFEDGLPYAFSGRGNIGFELCDAPHGFEERIAGRSRYYGGGSVGVRIEVVKGESYRLSGKYSQTFIDEMARQLTSAIESATGTEGVADSSVELVMVFASGTYMEHISENVTYRRLMLVDKVSAPRDFWIKWTRLDGAVAHPISAHVTADNILFELGEDVEQTIRQREYKYLLSSGKEKYHNSMSRRKVTEWREVIKRAARRGELTRIESDYELAPETLELEDRIAAMLGKKPADTAAPVKEEVPYISEAKPESDEYLRALEKARQVVEEASIDESEELALSEITDSLPDGEESETLTLEPEESSAVEFDGEDEPDEPCELEYEAEELPEEEQAEDDGEEPEDPEEDELDIFSDGDTDEDDDIFIDEDKESLPFSVVEGDDSSLDLDFDRRIEEIEPFDEDDGELVIEDEPAEADEEPEELVIEDEEPDEEIADEDEEAEEQLVIEDEDIEEEFVIEDGEPEDEVLIAEESEEEFVIEEPVAEEPAAEPVALQIPAEEQAEEPTPEITEPAAEPAPVAESIPEDQPAVSEQPSIAERVADIRAELETKIRLEYEIRAREKAEAALTELIGKYHRLETESELAIAELRSENHRLKRDYDLLLEQIESERFARESETARRRIEEQQLREEIERQLRAEAAERERLAESAREAVERQRILEAENARIEREREEAARAEEERLKREEQKRQLAAAHEAELERIRREQEETKAKVREAMSEIGVTKPNYITKTVKLIFVRSVDPNVITRIQQLIKATVDYYGKDAVSLRIRATFTDSRTVELEFVELPIDEMPLLGNIIKVLGQAGLGIIKAKID